MNKKTPSLNLLAAALALAAVLASNNAVAQTVAAVATGGKIIKAEIDANGNWGVTTTLADNVPYSYGIGYDSHGNMYYCNTPAGTINEITPGGTPTTVVSGLNYPSGLIIRCPGTFIVAEYGSGNFNQIMPGGAVTPIFSGFDGPVSVRQYWGLRSTRIDSMVDRYLLIYRGGSPGGVALVGRNPDGTWTNLQTIASALSFSYDAVPDRAGNVFVSEFGKNRILEFPHSSDGTISTNPAVFATGLSPIGLVFDHAGNLYEADFGGAINKFVLTNGTLNPNPIAVITGLTQPTYLAFPPPPIVRIHRAGVNVVLTWPDAIFAVQTADTLTGGFATVPGATSPSTNAIAAGTRFFRLESK